MDGLEEVAVGEDVPPAAGEVSLVGEVDVVLGVAWGRVLATEQDLVWGEGRWLDGVFDEPRARPLRHPGRIVKAPQRLVIEHLACMM